MTTRTLILVDVQNVYYTTRQIFRQNFDYNRFWAAATNNRQVVGAYAYAIDRGDTKQTQFQNILRAIGFEVKLKPFIQRADGSAKGDWDVGITVDALQQSAEADEVILVSGDGDFDVLVRALRQNGKLVHVYSVEKLTAQSLVRAADQYTAISAEFLLPKSG